VTQASEVRIKIKGSRKGLSITLGEGDWQELLPELDGRLRQADAFFQGSRVNLRTGKRNIDQKELKDLINVLVSHDIELVSVQTASEFTAEAARDLGLRLALPEAASAHPEVLALAEQGISEGLLIRRTLRSGQSLRHPGHVVVIGDVNPGAEVIAGGNVVVWGKLRGLAHAGAMGDDEAIVCALELTPTQLRIGSYIAVSPDEKTGKDMQPEIASVRDGRIVAEPWSAK